MKGNKREKVHRVVIYLLFLVHGRVPKIKPSIHPGKKAKRDRQITTPNSIQSFNI